jgi:hypothetical protein
MLMQNVVNKDKFLKALGMTSNLGNPQWPLPNMKEASERNFWGFRSTYSFRGEAWCGTKRIDGRWANILIYFADTGYWINGGFAVAYFYEYQKEEVKYYRWSACEHDFREVTIGRCLHKSTCTKCGASFETDSSD